MSDKNPYVEHISVGIIQTTVDPDVAWQKNASSPQMSESEDNHVWAEVCNALRAFQDDRENPRLILLPELSLPRTRLDDFERILGSLNAVAVVGVDYLLNHDNRIVRNEGIVFVPRNFFEDHPSRRCTRIRFGKTYPAPKENKKLQEMNPQWSFEGDSNVYVFDAQEFGRFGVAICWDIMDVERSLMYTGQVQHLFVLAYNRDLETFRSLANSLSRTVFCNLVICNTGFYGGSLVVSPYYMPHQRTLYEHNGSRLFTTQVVKLPVRDLITAQCRSENIDQSGGDSGLFKNPPPGFFERAQLLRQRVDLTRERG